MLERRNDGLGTFRGGLYALKVTIIALLIGSTIAFIAGKMLYR